MTAGWELKLIISTIVISEVCTQYVSFTDAARGQCIGDDFGNRNRSVQDLDIRDPQSFTSEVSRLASQSRRIDKREAAEFMNAANSEYYFYLLNTFDHDGCISKAVCELTASPKEYGSMGGRVSDVFKSFNPAQELSYSRKYKQTADAAMSSARCEERFRQCRLNVKPLLHLAEGQFKVLMQSANKQEDI